MDKQLTEKMESLLSRIEREDKRASSSFVVSMVCRILVTLLITCSLTYIGITFSNLAQPENVAIVVNQEILAAIPGIRTKIKQELPIQAKTLAEGTVKMVHRAIPMAGDMLEEQIETRFDKIMNHYKPQREQLFKNICSQVIDKIKKDKDLINDHRLAEALSIQLSDECNREIKDIINNAFFSEIDKLQLKIAKLSSTPNQFMTRSQAAKKNLIVSWIYLIDNKGIDDEGIVGNCASFMGGATENFISTQN
jgi:hypothetical protein